MFQISEDLLYGVIYPLAIFIFAIVLVVVIAEFKRSRAEKKLKTAELERQRAYREKMEALRRKKEEEAQYKALEDKVIKEKLEKEHAVRAVAMEKERRDWALIKIYFEMLTETYIELQKVLPKADLERVTSSHLTNWRLPVSLSERGFTPEGFIAETRLYDFIISLFKEYGENFGNPISNVALGEVKKYIRSHKLENFSEHFKTLSLLDMALKSACYLVEEAETTRSYALFTKLLEIYTGGAMCITRQSIDKIKEKYPGEYEIFWLSKVKVEHAIDPIDLEILMQTLEKFLELDKRIILIDGLEYLTVQNSYKTILKFIQSLVSIVVLKNSVLITPVNPYALEPRELALLERE